MKLVFSEAHPDYARYAFPYVVWGFPEPGETPADLLEAGFLPSSPQLDRFYLCRQLRVRLEGWSPNSENRRVLRKGAAFRCRLVPRAEFDANPGRRAAWLGFAHERFGPGVMPPERLDRILAAPVVSHVLHLDDPSTGRDVGSVLMYLEPPRVAFYYFAFYDLADRSSQLGMHLMTRAVEHFAASGYRHLHLGTCYDARALYKAQFHPMEYFTGWRWSPDLDALRALVRVPPSTGHLLEDPAHPAGVGPDKGSLPAATHFRMPRPPGT